VALASPATPEMPTAEPFPSPDIERTSTLPLPPPPRFYLAGIPVDRVSMEYATAWVLQALKTPESGKPLLILGPNAQLVTLAARQPRFAAALCSASLAVPDGISVVLAAHLLSQHVPERVPGGELMVHLCAEAARHDLSVFFLGGLPGAAEMTAQKFQRTFPAFRVAGILCPPPGFENDPIECIRIRKQITRTRPDLLCVAFGAPKQEIWMAENCPTLPIGAAISVGAAFDTQAGLRKRAPTWTHKVGLEWLYRLVHEPRRLWRRYRLGNTHFVWLVARQWWHQSMTDHPLSHIEQ
jgi:N-acetylglucosaminyldiphosphoundecaprenol N-acetyl-beta-D-mannosaminyltransferase